MVPDVIRTSAAEACAAVEGYQGEALTFGHPVVRALRRLERAYGGRLPSSLDSLWRHLRRDRSPVAAETLGRWLAAVAGDADAAESRPIAETVDPAGDADGDAPELIETGQRFEQIPAAEIPADQDEEDPADAADGDAE